MQSVPFLYNHFSDLKTHYCCADRYVIGTTIMGLVYSYAELLVAIA